MIVSTEKISPQGTLDYCIYRNGKLVEHVVDHNLVVNSGRNMLAKLIAGATTASPVKTIGFGSGTLEERLIDTDLVQPYVRIPIDSFTVEGNDVTFKWTLSTDQGNGINITEFGLFAGTGAMITHQVRGKVIGKDTDMVIEGKYILHF